MTTLQISGRDCFPWWAQLFCPEWEDTGSDDIAKTKPVSTWPWVNHLIPLGFYSLIVGLFVPAATFCDLSFAHSWDTFFPESLTRLFCWQNNGSNTWGKLYLLFLLQGILVQNQWENTSQCILLKIKLIPSPADSVVYPLKKKKDLLLLPREYNPPWVVDPYFLQLFIHSLFF